jgi:hypothetical protein
MFGAGFAFGPWFHVTDAVRDFPGNAFATIIELI